jgi:hypothetical protein
MRLGRDSNEPKDGRTEKCARQDMQRWEEKRDVEKILGRKTETRKYRVKTEIHRKNPERYVRTEF